MADEKTVIEPVSPSPREQAGKPLKTLLAATLSLFLPGAGQMYEDRRRRGLVMLAIALLLLIAVFIFWLQGETAILTLLLQPPVLLGLLVVDVGVLLFRLYCVADTFWPPRLGLDRSAAWPQRLPGIGTLVGLVLVILVTIAPHTAAGYYDLVTYQLLTGVFNQSSTVRAESFPTPVLAGVNGSPTEPPEDLAPVVIATPAPTRTPVKVVPTPSIAILPSPSAVSNTPTPTSPWPGVDRLNILLLGGDAGPGRSGLRTDTMMVVSIQPSTGRTAIFGIPRNLVGVPLPDGPAQQFYDGSWPSLLNALYGYGQANPGLFPGGKDPGATALKETIGGLLGIQIDYYALVDLPSFVNIIDALGGVTIDVPREIDDITSPPTQDEPWQEYDILPGRQHLDGRAALTYVRSRTGSSDFDRMQRQR
jgi:LCP family protein required for cell wall assembly